MQLKIEKGVDLPAGRVGRENSFNRVIPWDDLKVGDSVLVPREICEQYANPGGTLTGCAINRGIKISVRTYPEGIRIWRTA